MPDTVAFGQAIAVALDTDAALPEIEHAHLCLPSVFDVSGLAAAAIGAAAAEVARLSGSTAPVVVHQGVASSWFSSTIEPVDFELPPVWDTVAGDYRCADGWIRLHTNAPHHRAAAMRVLATPVDREAIAAETAKWQGTDLESAIVDAGGYAAEMRDIRSWSDHRQGAAVTAEPLISWSGRPAPWSSTDPGRPLDSLRVLDLTRVLAGPTCTRFLAGWGADVLRIDPPDWEEPTLAPDVTLGKRCARLDLRTDADAFALLVGDAEVIVHGYRPGALAGLGFDRFEGIVDVALDAYGWTGPWAYRRGFDSLVQMSSGIAAAGMAAYGTDKPEPLPVQALDHATGYLMAASVVRALRGGPSRARLSLSRTASLLAGRPGDPEAEFHFEPPTTHETTAWGAIRRAVPPVRIGEVPMRWDRPACPLGFHRPVW